ncbi:type II CAAX endopeptidase family protein [Sphingomonas sp. ST-64]|uniref:Type II CAAX endopeptidase family protein n=1 Tax=Sphingomonas plantiphila TaxID=3163295 RepID=A0ABW8YRZ2_9SPHN
MRAIGKAAVYLGLALVAALLVSSVLKVATGRNLQQLMQAGPGEALIAHAGLLLALVIIPTALSLLVWKDRFATSGWSGAGGGRLAALGAASGAGMMFAIVAILWVAGAWSGGAAVWSGGELARMVLLSVMLWVVQAAHEEGLHRGYAFVQLSRAISFWPAAALLSLWFMWGHVGQEGATPLSMVVAGLFALVLAWSLLRTGSLWFALGFHASWNFAQSFVFGLNNSGGRSANALMVSRIEGPSWLTGGSAGPEGSVLSLVAIAALVAVVHFGAPRRDVDRG